jgi:hypothetical protein
MAGKLLAAFVRLRMETSKGPCEEVKKTPIKQNSVNFLNGLVTIGSCTMELVS